MDEARDILNNPITQYGLAGVCSALLCIMVWLMRELLTVIKENNGVISRHSEVLTTFSEMSRNTFEMQVELKDKLLSRPCLLPPRER
jgi:hypothetical protein